MARALPNPGPYSMQNRSRLVRFGVFAFHCWVATIASTLIALFVGAFVVRFIGEQAGDALAAILGGPFFLAFLAVGFCLGFWINRWLKSALAKWVWILPLIGCLVLMIGQIRYADPGGVLHEIWVDYFGNGNCGGTECLGEVFGTWPLFSAIGYAIGSSLGRKRKPGVALSSKRDSTPSRSQSNENPTT